MIRAALHVHSTYSDGEFSLSELREKFMRAGCDAVAMADHADAFDDQAVKRYREECKQLSDERFAFLPGLEFGCVERMHIVGYGVTTLVDSTDPQTVIAHIRRHGGVAVIAHPPDTLFGRIREFDVLPDGIEGWNSKYDGQYAPRPATFELITRLRHRQPSLRAFYGQDLHWRRQFAGLFTDIDIPTLDRASMLTALASGKYEGFKDSLRLPSDGELPAHLLIRFGAVNTRSRRFYRAVATLRRTLGHGTSLLPESVKSQLRRFF